MKWSLACFLLFLPLVAIHAQQERKQAEKEVRAMSRELQLDASQKNIVRDIQLEYFSNHREIEGLKNSNYRLYLQKCRNIRLGMEAMVAKVLDQGQRAEYLNSIEAQKSSLQAELYELQKQGMSKEQLELRALEWYLPME